MKQFFLLCGLLCLGCASIPSDLRVARVTSDAAGTQAELVLLKYRDRYTVFEGSTFDSEGKRFIVSSISPESVVLMTPGGGREFTVPHLTAQEALKFHIYSK